MLCILIKLTKGHEQQGKRPCIILLGKRLPIPAKKYGNLLRLSQVKENRFLSYVKILTKNMKLTGEILLSNIIEVLILFQEVLISVYSP